MKQFEQTLQVAVQNERVLVTLKFHNRTSDPVFVRDLVAVDDELSTPVFEVRTSDGEAIPYIGMMVKRGPITADDYHSIAPQSAHTNTIDITRSYGFKPGRHRYILSYSGAYLKNLDHLNEVSADAGLQAEFVYVK